VQCSVIVYLTQYSVVQYGAVVYGIAIWSGVFLCRFDAERWRSEWQALFDNHDLVHNHRETC
jgi:hypothetical protein